MSELRVDNIVDMGGSGAPQLRKGANVTGISTITQAVVGNATINAGGINATGIVTSSSNKFVGDLASGNITAGVMTATSSVVASNITINAGGVNASGIVSATSYQGSGANLSGIGLTIAPLAYNPDVNDILVTKTSGIGLTFNQRVSAGVGTVTLSLVSVGSTVAEVFGLGNATSTTYTVTVASSKFYLDGNLQYSPALYPGNIYPFDQSAGTNATHPLRFATAADAAGSTEYTTGVETNGTPGSSGAYTRITVAADAPDTLYYYCTNHSGMGSNVSIGANVQYNNDANPPNITITPKNSLNADTVYAINYPPGAFTQSGAGGSFVGAGYTFDSADINNTMWSWGNNGGELGQNNRTRYSSPTQIGTDGTWDKVFKTGADASISAIQKTDGTVWVMGYNADYRLGLGDENARSSPTQLPGTNWFRVGGNDASSAGVKTDGTLWTWGTGGAYAHNNTTTLVSPKQVGSDTTWSTADIDGLSAPYMCTKTDGTLWAWGGNTYGILGQNSRTVYSSPIQIPGTTWRQTTGGTQAVGAIKTDGTLWVWGRGNNFGQLGQNGLVSYSSPVQIPGTTWKVIRTGEGGTFWGFKTDGTLWGWGSNYGGLIGENLIHEYYSSPIQVPGTTWVDLDVGDKGVIANKSDGTLWSWGYGRYGALGVPSLGGAPTVYRSSPVQIPGTNWSTSLYAISRDSTSCVAMKT